MPHLWSETALSNLVGEQGDFVTELYFYMFSLNVDNTCLVE